MILEHHAVVDHMHCSQYSQIITEFQSFKKLSGAFANILLAIGANILPHEWWDLVDKGDTHLVSLAKPLSAQVYSLSSYERN